MGNENEVSGEPRPAGVKSKSLLSYAAGERTARSPAPAQPKPSLAVGQILVSVRSTQQPPAHQPPPEWTPVIASSHVKSQVILVCGRSRLGQGGHGVAWQVEKLLAGLQLLTGVSDGGPPRQAVALAGVCGAGAVVLAEVLLDLVARDLHRRQRVPHSRLRVHVLRCRGRSHDLGVAAEGASGKDFKRGSKMIRNAITERLSK